MELGSLYPFSPIPGLRRRCATATTTISFGSIQYRIPKGNLRTRHRLSLPSIIGHISGDSAIAATARSISER